MANRDVGEVRYRAFLSYSHKDAAAAGRLHRRLEAYRIPRRLIGRETGSGPVPARLAPIFRDREELPAATDLSETVRAALARSGSLIILCSPNAAGSLWVAEEIRVFRELHPDRPILAAILDGDPPDCFPPLLRVYGEGHEPLATDLRRHRDGERLGLLKLVAGIAGLGLDDLVQRDASRRVRRVMAVTVGAVAAMLVMAVLTWFAFDARREAERQRAEAEGLVEFMLTDLRDRLRGVGRLDIMSAVNARALRYYGAQRELSELSDDSLSRRARVLQAIGDDDISGDRLESALAAFRDAHAATAELLLRAPDDPERIFVHGKSEFGIGRVYEIRRDWPRARRHYQVCASAADRLIAQAPNNPDYMARVASCAVNLGNVELRGTRNYLSAQGSYQGAINWLGRAVAIRPGDPHLLLSQANAYGWLADSFFVRGLWAQSLDARRHQYDIVDRLQRARPDSADVAFRLAAARRGLAHAYFRNAGQGDSGRARSQLFQAYEAIVLLTRRDPQNAEWRMLRGLLAYDLINFGLGLPPGFTAAQLRQDAAARDSHHDERRPDRRTARTSGT